MERTYSHIDLDERRKIARWRTVGFSVEVIAEKLGRHLPTIFREIKRNMFVEKVVPDLNGYYCVTARDMACERRAKLRKLAFFECEAIRYRPDQTWLVAAADRWPDAPRTVPDLGQSRNDLQVRVLGGRTCNQAVASSAGASG